MRESLSAIALCSLLVSAPAQACDLDGLVGWTLIAKKTVVAYVEDGVKEDGYQGCSYGRILVFSDGTGASCATYNYNYAYRPNAYVFSDGYSFKACIDDEMVDLRPLR